jgi:uncharacterized membrane protein (DUF106 family)
MWSLNIRQWLGVFVSCYLWSYIMRTNQWLRLLKVQFNIIELNKWKLIIILFTRSWKIKIINIQHIKTTNQLAGIIAKAVSSQVFNDSLIKLSIKDTKRSIWEKVLAWSVRVLILFFIIISFVVSQLFKFSLGIIVHGYVQLN